jgi:hypothetical protein
MYIPSLLFVTLQTKHGKLHAMHIEHNNTVHTSRLMLYVVLGIFQTQLLVLPREEARGCNSTDSQQRTALELLFQHCCNG